jgi:hypothetical protein
MSRRICLVVVASFALAGCDLTNKEDAQYDDARNPYYKQAQQDLDNNNPAAAVSDYEAALGANAKLASAHYQLGILYGDKLGDPIGSVFHFKRFLDLAPNSDKVDQVKAWIDKQSQAFAASLPNSPAQSADDYAKLQGENAALKKQVEDATKTIAQLQAQLAHGGKHHTAATAETTPPPAATPTPAPVISTPAVAATDAPATPTPIATNAAAVTPPRALPVDLTATNESAGAPTGASRSYKVVSGDSLWKIAHKMYPGDTKNGIDKIKEANKDILIEGKPLKIGQVLVIPE